MRLTAHQCRHARSRVVHSYSFNGIHISAIRMPVIWITARQCPHTWLEILQNKRTGADAFVEILSIWSDAQMIIDKSCREIDIARIERNGDFMRVSCHNVCDSEKYALAAGFSFITTMMVERIDNVFGSQFFAIMESYTFAQAEYPFACIGVGWFPAFNQGGCEFTIRTKFQQRVKKLKADGVHICHRIGCGIQMVRTGSRVHGDNQMPAFFWLCILRLCLYWQ